VVTTQAVRVALETIASAVCGTSPALIRVAMPKTYEPQICLVALPPACREEVYRYLLAKLDLAPQNWDDPIVMTADQVTLVLQLATDLSLASGASLNQLIRT
jgi:hypothetical protein